MLSAMAKLLKIQLCDVFQFASPHTLPFKTKKNRSRKMHSVD